MTHQQVVEATRATLRVEEEAVPGLVVVFVARAWGEVHVDVGGRRLLEPFALAARFHEHRHGAFTVKGIEVERELVTVPAAFVEAKFHRAAVGQTELGMAAVALALTEQIDASIHIVHARKDVSVAIGIEAHAEEVPPPGTVHVHLKIHDAALVEAEVEVGRGFAGGGPTHAGAPVGIPYRDGFVGGHVRSADIAHVEVL